MSALRGVVIAVALSLAACTSRPVVQAVEAPNAAVTDSNAATSGAGEDDPAEAPSTLVELVRRTHEKPNIVAVFTSDGRASRSVRALSRAGYSVQIFDGDFARATRDMVPRPIDLVIVEAAPRADWRAPARQISRDLPVIATWIGRPAPDLASGFELAEGSGALTTHYVVWHNGHVEGRGLAVRPVPPREIAYESGDSALVIGQLTRVGDERLLLINSDRGVQRVSLRGDAARLAHAKSVDDRPDAIAAVRGRLRFQAAIHPVTYWDLDVEEVRLDLDDAAVHEMRARHAKIFATATKHIANDQLVLAANALEDAAKLVDDTLDGLGDRGSEEVRFDRLIARRLREVAAAGGGGRELVERVVSFRQYEPATVEQHELIEATVRLAAPKLLRAYRTRPASEAELAARMYLYVHGGDPQSPTAREINRRFPAVRADDPRVYVPPPFFGEGDSKE